MPQLDLGKVVGDTGPQGPKGDQGIQGPAGQTGPGVAVGGSANQVLVKHSGTNYDTQWVDAGNLPSIAGVQNAVAIVANGDTHPAIASGQFVYVRNHSTLAEGLYKATAAIGTDVALTTSNLTADGSGGLNDLKGQIDSLNSNINNIVGKYIYDQSGSIETYLGTLPNNTQWVVSVTNNSSTGSLVTLSGQHLFSITQLCSSDNTKYQIAVAVNTPYVYYRIYRWYNSSWSDWYELERKIQVVSTGSKTISTNGNISYTFENKVLVLGAYSTSSDIVCSVYPSSGADSSGSATWWIHCRNANSSSSVASGTITCYIIYIDMA